MSPGERIVVISHSYDLDFSLIFVLIKELLIQKALKFEVLKVIFNVFVCVPEHYMSTCVCRSPGRSSEGAGSPGTELQVVVSLCMGVLGTESMSSSALIRLWFPELCFAARDGR